MAARESGGKGGVKGGEAMTTNKIATFVGSVPASTAGICGHMQGKGECKWGVGSYVKAFLRGFASDVRAKGANIAFATSIAHSSGFSETNGVMRSQNYGKRMRARLVCDCQFTERNRANSPNGIVSIHRTLKDF